MKKYAWIKNAQPCSKIKLSQKLKDPGRLIILCYIGDLFFQDVLYDLGASKNLMPYFVFKCLGIGELKQIFVTLQLATISIKYPRVVEDILVKGDKFIFLVDFVVLDMEEDSNMPLSLGRPFLNMGRTLINVHKSEQILRLGYECATFNINETMKHPQEDKSRFCEHNIWVSGKLCSK